MKCEFDEANPSIQLNSMEASTSNGLQFIALEIIKTDHRLATCVYQNRRTKDFFFTTKVMLTAATGGHC